MTSVELIAAACAACVLIGLLLAANFAQWMRLRDQQQHYEGRLEEQEKKHAERIKSIGQQLRNMPKRKTDRLPE